MRESRLDMKRVNKVRIDLIESGATQEEIARATGYSQGTVSLFLSGAVNDPRRLEDYEAFIKRRLSRIAKGKNSG